MYGTLDAKFEERQTIMRAEMWTHIAGRLGSHNVSWTGSLGAERSVLARMSRMPTCREGFGRSLKKRQRHPAERRTHRSFRTIRGRPTSIELSGVSASPDAPDAQGEVAISTCQVAADVWLEKSSTQSCAGGKADTSVITILCARHTTRVKSASGAQSAQAIRDLTLVQSF